MLDELEKQSSAWLKVLTHMDKRLTSLRTQLESDLNEVETAKVRARIKELSYLRSTLSPASGGHAEKSPLPMLDV